MSSGYYRVSVFVCACESRHETSRIIHVNAVTTESLCSDHIMDKCECRHETSSGYYRVSVFFIAKCITDMLIIRAVPLSVFSAITYFMIGQPHICMLTRHTHTHTHTDTYTHTHTHTHTYRNSKYSLQPWPKRLALNTAQISPKFGLKAHILSKQLKSCLAQINLVKNLALSSSSLQNVAQILSKSELCLCVYVSGLQANVAKFFLFYLTLVFSAVGAASLSVPWSACSLWPTSWPPSFLSSA